MQARIHRETHEIGATCIEVAHAGVRLLLDLDLPLDGEPDDTARQPGIEGMAGGGDLKALVLSHGHRDHVGRFRVISAVDHGGCSGAPKELPSTALTVEEAAIIVAFRRHMLLPLDDRRYGLPPTIPHLTRSVLHRCLERHGISRLSEVDGDKPRKRRFARYAIGYAPIDLAEVGTAEGKLRLFVAIDRTSRFAFARWRAPERWKPLSSYAPSSRPYPTVFMPCASTTASRSHHAAGISTTASPSSIVCDRRLTKADHPWTEGQVERMNRTIKDATVQRYHYDSHDQIRTHRHLFVDAHNHACSAR